MACFSPFKLKMKSLFHNRCNTCMSMFLKSRVMNFRYGCFPTWIYDTLEMNFSPRETHSSVAPRIAVPSGRQTQSKLMVCISEVMPEMTSVWMRSTFAVLISFQGHNYKLVRNSCVKTLPLVQWIAKVFTPFDIVALKIWNICGFFIIWFTQHANNPEDQKILLWRKQEIIPKKPNKTWVCITLRQPKSVLCRAPFCKSLGAYF